MDVTLSGLLDIGMMNPWVLELVEEQRSLVVMVLGRHSDEMCLRGSC